MSESTELERWSRSLLTAPDDRFFRIMRTYLGDVKTPFNKHSLIKRLGALFRSEDVGDRMISLIDSRDAQTLSAIALLDEPTAPRLFQLFEGDIEFLKLHYHIMNLEERMLVYRDEEDERRIRFNPILKHTIEREVLDPALIFRITKATAKPSHLDWPSDSRLLGLVSYLSSAHSLFKSDGSETVLDVIYAPLVTRFLERANRAGCRTMNGWQMLLEQAYLQFEQFTGISYPVDEVTISEPGR